VAQEYGNSLLLIAIAKPARNRSEMALQSVDAKRVSLCILFFAYAAISVTVPKTSPIFVIRTYVNSAT
jgi:hypothetical protein